MTRTLLLLLFCLLALSYALAWRDGVQARESRAAALAVLEQQIARHLAPASRELQDYGLASYPLRGESCSFSYYITASAREPYLVNFAVRGPEADSGRLKPRGYMLQARLVQP